MRTLAALLFFGVLAHGQTCSVDGTVVNSETGAPVVRAHVSVVGASVNAPADSDVNGKWRLDHIECGRLTLIAARPGFLKLQQTDLSLDPESPSHGLSIKLAPQAVIAGRVFDEQGDPIPGAQVSLLTSRIVNGLRGLQPTSSAATDDRGEYRFAGLAAGKYLVCAVGPGGDGGIMNGARLYGERCYPGPADAGPAAAMEVVAGYEGRFDFTLTPIGTVSVSGVLSGSPDNRANGVTLVPRIQRSRAMGAFSAPVRPDGTFMIRNVPPGSYLLTGRTANSGSTMAAHIEVEVGSRDVEGIRLNVEPGVRVAGTVKVVSATGRKIERPQYSIALRSAEFVMGTAQTEWDDARTAFTIASVPPDDYRLQASPPAPFYLKSATLDGRDIMGTALAIGPGAGTIEVVLSDDGGSIEGEVSTSDGPATGWVYLERDGNAARNVRADPKGHFKIDPVPPGDYKIYAWDDNSKVEYGSPDWMQRNGKGVAVTVAASRTTQVKLVRQVAPPE